MAKAALRVLSVALFALFASPLGAGNNPDPNPIDPATDPTEVLVSVFDDNGWTPADAEALADRAIARLLGERVAEYIPIDGPEYSDDNDAYLADPDTEATALWYHAFTSSGWPAADAIGFVEAYVAQLNPEDGASPEEGKCLRYLVRAVYCSGGEKIRRDIWVSKDCWEEEVLNCIDFAPACDPGDSLWLNLPLHCAGQECATVTDRGIQALLVPCSWGVVKCDCFYTDGQVFCDVVSVKCCDMDKSCDGCPDCN